MEYQGIQVRTHGTLNKQRFICKNCFFKDILKYIYNEYLQFYSLLEYFKTFNFRSGKLKSVNNLFKYFQKTDKMFKYFPFCEKST